MLALVSVLVIFATLMTSPTLSAVAVHVNGNQKSKDKPKDPKCNNVQILLKVSKIPNGSKSSGTSNVGWKDLKQETTC